MVVCEWPRKPKYSVMPLLSHTYMSNSTLHILSNEYYFFCCCKFHLYTEYSSPLKPSPLTIPENPTSLSKIINTFALEKRLKESLIIDQCNHDRLTLEWGILWHWEQTCLWKGITTFFLINLEFHLICQVYIFIVPVIILSPWW